MAQNTLPRKKLLVIGEEKGYRHEAVSHAMATIERLGRQTGIWDTVIRTDTEALTKKKLEYNAKNLNDFDAVLFYTGGNIGILPPRPLTTYGCRSGEYNGQHRHQNPCETTEPH